MSPRQSSPIDLSLSAARNLLLAAQGLLRRPRKKVIAEDILVTIRRMGALQIDSISVVARSPYLVLFSRLGEYDPTLLDRLLADGMLFEYWSHEACFLPIEDFPLYRHRMLGAETMGWRYARSFVEEHRAEMNALLELVRERGEVRAIDFARTDGKSAGWWEWKVEKRLLESLFTAGELMVARRQGFQRVYTLRSTLLPDWRDADLPSPDEVRRTLLLKAVRALGVARARWVGDYFRMKNIPASYLDALVDDGLLLHARVEGSEERWYLHPDALPDAQRAAAGKLEPELTTLLSPFDPVVWDRARALALFGFDYRIECYTPEAKRIYGYFTLPILRRGALVGRLDAKAHRKEGRFEIKALYLEPGTTVDELFLSDIATALREAAAWHRTPEIDIVATEPRGLRRRLAAMLRHEES
jgi:uncharacterized protein YcaQ